MLTLLTFPGYPGEPSMSNFCTKAMVLLHMAGEDFTAEMPQDMGRAFHGKLPALETPGGLVGDSNLLIPWLVSRGADLFPGLSAAQRAQAHAVMRMIEENLRYGMMYHRWIDPEGWAAFMPLAFADMPEDMREGAAAGFRDAIRKGLEWQGIARFTEDQRMAYFNADLDALTALLEDGGWLLGTQPTAADASVLSVLTGLETLLVDCPLRRAVRENPALMRYIAMGRETLYAPLLTLSASAA